MGSSLGPALANIFVGYQEAKLFNIAKRLLVYFWYVDNTFIVFNNKEDCNTSHPPQLPSSLTMLHLQKEIQSLSPLPGCVGRKARFGISNPNVQETHLHQPVSTLELLQPPKMENKPNWYSCSQSFYDLFKKQTGPRAWQNSFNSIRKWLPGTCNQFGFQTKTSTTKF